MTLRTLISPSILSLVAATSLLAACGGGGGDDGALSGDSRQRALKGGDCTGSCSGGGGTPVVGAENPLPTVAPGPGVLVRESFGPGPRDLRPKGGKGDLRSAFIGSTLGGFWVEWPGSKSAQWITPAGESTWKFTSSISGSDPVGNPHELPSPLEVNGMRGQAWSDVSDGAVSGFPTALMPVRLPSTLWTLSIEGTPAQAVGSYVALGITDSSATLGNLAQMSRVTLVLKADDGQGMAWELWLGGAVRTLLSSGRTDDMTWNRMLLKYDPSTFRLSAEVNGVAAGPFVANLVGARYAGFEGSGMVDDFVLRTGH